MGGGSFSILRMEATSLMAQEWEEGPSGLLFLWQGRHYYQPAIEWFLAYHSILGSRGDINSTGYSYG
jgi:hypothetical protein